MFYTREALQCYDHIEAAYYATQDEKKIVCSRCFGGGEIVKQKIIEEARNTEGYDFLPLCKLCFDANIPVARSGKKKRNFFLAKIQSNKHDTRENCVDTRGKRATKKKKLE